MTFFCKFAKSSVPHRVVCRNLHFLQKVLLKLSSVLKLGGLYSTKMIDNSTCIGCLYPAVNGRLYAISGVGLLFYLWNGTPRPKNEIKQVHSSHLFYVRTKLLQRRMRGVPCFYGCNIEITVSKPLLYGSCRRCH